MPEWEYDPFAADVQADFGPAYRELRAHCPVHHYTGYGPQGFWSVARYEDVRALASNNQAWTMRYGSGPNEQDPGCLGLDLPARTPFRRLLVNGISPARVARLEPVIRTETHKLLEAVDAESGFDVAADLALPLTSTMTATLLGIPVDAQTRKQWRLWAESFMVTMQDEDASAFERATAEMYAFLAELITTRRAEIEGGASPADTDFLSEIAVARKEGEYFAITDLTRIAGGVFVGAQGTTTSFLASMVLRLLEQRGRWESVLADRSLVEGAIEETLRHDPPVLGTFRTATEGTVVRGVEIPAKGKVISLFASANRDETVFNNGETFDLHRPEDELKRHIAFGVGTHLCPGSHLARAQGRIVLTQLIDRFPHLRLAAAPGPRVQPFFLWGPSSVPVVAA